MKVFITGGSGFVGSALVRHLASMGIKSTVYDNQLSGAFGEVARNAACIYGDVRNLAHLKQSISGHDVVVHLAGVVGAPACDLDKYLSYETNVTGTQNVVSVLEKGQKLINISSTSVYGDKAGEFVNELAHPEPLSSYGAHKLQAEVITRTWENHIIFRPATAFGISDRVRVDLLPNTLMYEALTTGTINLYQPHVIRPFIHVRDFARAIAWAVMGHVPWGETYNLGNPQITMTKRELATLIAEHTGAKIVPMDGSDTDKRNYNVDFFKFAATLFDFTRVFFDGIQDMRGVLEYVQANYDTCNTVYNTKRYLETYGHTIN